MSDLLISVVCLVVASPGLSLVDPYDAPQVADARPTVGRTHYAAAGEYEVFGVRLQNNTKIRRLLACEVVWDGDEDLPTTCFRQARATDFIPGVPFVPDAYAPFDAMPLQADGTLDLLLVVQVPESAVPGRRRGVVHARFDDQRSMNCGIELRVFDFAMPATPVISTLFDLDLAYLAQVRGRPYANLDLWTPDYDSLTNLGVAYRVWTPPESSASKIDTTTLRKHLGYVAATSAAPVVDVGGEPGYFTAKIPSPTEEARQDALQTHLHDLFGVVDRVGRGTMAVAQPAQVGPRAGWHQVRQDYARYARADDRVKRILVAPIHPHFERYTDIWALPGAISPMLVNLLATGRSLLRYDQRAVSRCVGTEGALDGTGRYQTLASEAVDGSEATVWLPARNGVEMDPWLEVTFRELFRIEHLTILSAATASVGEPTVETAYRPGAFVSATVKWKAARQPSEADTPMLTGTFRYPRECRALRIRFPASEALAREGIAEVLFNNDVIETISEPVEPVIPWLDATAVDYPAWRLGGVGAAASTRSLPWRCWSQGFQGILGPTLNHVPPGQHALVGIGKEGLLPTQRLFALRDGLEDVEYLHLYWERVARKGLNPPPGFSPGRGIESFDQSVAGNWERRRVREKTGKLLSGEALVRKNFGP